MKLLKKRAAIKSIGGIAEMNRRDIAKASKLYDFIDASDYYKCPVRKEDRSLMNVVFVIGDKGQKLTADIKDQGWNKWITTTIKDVVVKDGKATIGVDMDANAGNWGSFDNFEFYLQE